MSKDRIIKRISINKSNVSIYFINDNKRLSISHEAYASMYLYVNKSLSNKEYNQLVKTTRLTKLIEYSLSILKKGHMSEYRLREKLYLKEANKEDVDFIINRLKATDLINDTMFALDYIEYCNDRHIGKNKIIHELSNKGIFIDKIKNIKFPYDIELEKGLYQLDKLIKKYDSYPYNKKRSKVYASLLSLGFDTDLALSLSSKIPNDNKSNKKVLDKLNRDYISIYNRLSRRIDNPKELSDKIYKSLVSKGYSYKDIKRVMNRSSEDDIYENDF